MNPYAMMASGSGTSISSALAARLAAWHDAMVAHERRLRTGRTRDVCDDECPHVEARTLWTEALATFGDRAHELSFLRSRATSLAQPTANPVGAPPTELDRVNNGRSPMRAQTRAAGDARTRRVISTSLRSQRLTAEAEL